MCSRWYHQHCNDRNRTEHVSDNGIYTCEKCINSMLPLFECALFGEGQRPCKKCKGDCLDGMQYFQCVVCNSLNHQICSKISKKYFYHAIEFHKDLIYRDKCYISSLPFSC